MAFVELPLGRFHPLRILWSRLRPLSEMGQGYSHRELAYWLKKMALKKDLLQHRHLQCRLAQLLTRDRFGLPLLLPMVSP